MIPFFQQPSFSIGPITIHAFGIILAASVVTGDLILRRRVQREGLDQQIAASLSWYAVVVGFVFAHLFALVLYFPDKIVRDPLSILRLWEDVSSFGGMIGGVLGAVLFLRTKGAHLTSSQRWAYLDAAAFVLPFAWAIGRVACAVAHDHPGSITSFPLAISLERPEAVAFIRGVYASAGLALPSVPDLRQLGFHDLGWYEFLYLTFIVAPIFWLGDRSRAVRANGWWLGLFCVLYAPMRIALDILRMSDRRYWGFTPGQLVAVGMLGLGVWLLARSPQASRAAAEGDTR